MKEFIGEDFLLDSETAQYLYDNHASKMPIYDFHSHLSAEEIALDRVYENITEVWLGHDHYKWRAMRTFGIDEKYITGNADDREKFIKYAEMVPYTLGNPLYHWTHMELREYFGIYDTLSSSNSNDIYTACNIKLKSLSAREIIKQSNVKVICTTDDPTDDLRYHKKIKVDSDFGVQVIPTFRPDKGINLNDNFDDWLKALEKVENIEIDSFEDYLSAFKNRIKYFDGVGCMISDNGLDNIEYISCNKEEACEIFDRKRQNSAMNWEDIIRFRSYMIHYLGSIYYEYGWGMQLHIGALRNNSTRMYSELGTDTGFDSINDKPIAESLSNLLNDLDIENKLPKTIIYCLNPADNEVVASMIGNFQSGGVNGKIQFGTAWWFNDQKDGIERHLETLSQFGLLSTFVGMVTDSRSLLSFPRHDYFRRILCNKIGNFVENGEYPNDKIMLGNIIEGICYNNANRYFVKRS